MADDVARLVAVMEANLKGFQKGMEQAQKIADRRFGQIERRMNKAERSFANFGRTIGNIFGGALTVAGITRFVSSVSDMAGKLQDTSEALGVSTDSLQTWGILAGRAGVNQEQFNKALSQFSQKLGEAQLKGGSFAKFLTGIGVGTSGTTEDVFNRLADAIKNTADQQQRAAIVAEAFGAKAVRLTPILQQGSAALRAQGVEFAKNGQIMTRESIAKLDELGDKWEDLKRQFTAIGGNVLAGFADEFSQFATELSSPEFQSALNNFGKVLADVLRIVAKLAPFLPEIAGAFIGARFGPGGALVGVGLGALGAILSQSESVEEMTARVKRLKSALSDLEGAGLASAQAQIADLQHKIAGAAGIPFRRPGSASTATGGGIDRSGSIPEGGQTVAEREGKLEIETLHEVESAVRKILEKRLEDDREFRSEQYNIAREKREQLTRDELDGLDEFHAEADARWADYWERQADMAQDAHDLFKEDIGDSLLYLGEAALQGGDAFTNALRQMIIQATLLAIKLNVLKPLLDWALGGAPGAGFIGNILGPGRASGGRVYPGTVYPVGERGPELFSPDTAGTIIPRIPSATAVTGSRAMTVDLRQQIDLTGANGDATIAAIARQASAEGTLLAISTIRKQFPAMMIKAQRDSL